MRRALATPATQAPSLPASLPYETRDLVPQAGERGEATIPSPAKRERGRERAAPQARKAKRVALGRVKALRRDQTDAELRLWYRLRAGRFLGLKFKRQHPIGPYIADFVCLEHGLIVEADGGQHGDTGHDATRDAFLASRGLRGLRFWNDDILQNTDAVLESIRLAAGEAPSPPTPLPYETRDLVPQAGEGNRS